MKRNKFLYVLLAGLLALSSCELNNLPEFDDKDAFVAFDRLLINAPEESGEVRIPVTLSSLAGIAGTATFELDDAASTAKEGESYTIKNSSTTLTFSKDAPTQYIELGLIDNDLFTGDLSVTFKLTASSINLGANTTVRVVIVDNEHPLLFIMGTYSGKLTSYWEDEYDAEITISKDESDASKVWIANLDPYFASYGYVAPNYNYFYGVVNDEKTEIRIPIGQNINYTSETILLNGLDSPNPDEGDFLPSGGFIIVEILDGGAQLRIPNAWGVADETPEFWELYLGGAVFTKE